MDFFGIGQAIKGVLQVYFWSSRQSGRTTSLVEGVKTGDRIVFTNRKEADRVQRLCKERGINVKCIVVNPRQEDDILRFGSVPGDGRNIFDHTWIEEYYMNKIEFSREKLAFIEKETSGYCSAHRETKRKAMEISRWSF